MSIGRIDLNLVKVFDAVYEERNLVRAGKRLHLSQSAVSHALARLHEITGSHLFVRTARGMAPTARADAIARQLRESLRSMENALLTGDFDPATASRRFVVAANDHMTAVLVSRLSEALERLAPGIELIVRPSTRLDLAEQIDVGRVDAAIGIFAQTPDRYRSAALFDDSEAVLMRAGHPLTCKTLSLQDLAGHTLLTVSVGGQEEGAVGGFILERGLARQSDMFDRAALEDALAGIGARPSIRRTVPHSLAIPRLLAQSDMLSIVPASLARSLTRDGGLVEKPLPYSRKASTVRVVWHGRNDRDKAHAWLRQMIVECASKVAPARRARTSSPQSPARTSRRR